MLPSARGEGKRRRKEEKERGEEKRRRKEEARKEEKERGRKKTGKYGNPLDLRPKRHSVILSSATTATQRRRIPIWPSGQL
jgi:hypothetical protein